MRTIILFFALTLSAIHAQEPPKVQQTCTQKPCANVANVKGDVAIKFDTGKTMTSGFQIWSEGYSAPIITIQLPERADSKTYLPDWSKALDKETKWTFTVDGKEYKLTGEQLKDAVKKAAEASK